MGKKVYEKVGECVEVRARPVLEIGPTVLPRVFEAVLNSPKLTFVTDEPLLIGKKYRVTVEEVDG